MAFQIRTVFLSGGIAAIVAGALAAPTFFPAAFAAEPQKHLLDRASDMFPKPFNPKSLMKFDITLDNSVSTDATRTQIVKKIGFGQRTTVAIVTTPSGTYSSDAITSPYVRYPGIDVSHKHWCGCGFAYGSATPHVSVSTSVSDWGTWTSTRVQSGSFTYLTSHFTPAKRSRT